MDPQFLIRLYESHNLSNNHGFQKTDFRGITNSSKTYPHKIFI